MKRILFDCRAETLYPLAKSGFSGGSQTYVKAIIAGLLKLGYEVHVIANDLEVDERRGPNEFWWPTDYHPRKYDVVVMQMHAVEGADYDAPTAVLMTSCVDPYLGQDNAAVSWFDAYPVFSEVHKDLLCKLRPVPAEKCFITGLGVDLKDYEHKSFAPVPGRMLYANDPARGLFYVLDIFDLVKKQVPHATLHVAYNFDQQLEFRKWEHTHMAAMLLDCRKRMAETEGVTKLNDLTRAQIIREQLECQVHCMPSDPPGIGTQTHGLSQVECAAAGCALVLSDIEAFPEVFGTGATILPVIGKFISSLERKVTAADYANVVVDLMTNPEAWAASSKAAKKMAKRYTWSGVVAKWDKMLKQLTEGRN